MMSDLHPEVIEAYIVGIVNDIDLAREHLADEEWHNTLRLLAILRHPQLAEEYMDQYCIDQGDAEEFRAMLPKSEAEATDMVRTVVHACVFEGIYGWAIEEVPDDTGH